MTVFQDEKYIFVINPILISDRNSKLVLYYNRINKNHVATCVMFLRIPNNEENIIEEITEKTSRM